MRRTMQRYSRTEVPLLNDDNEEGVELELVVTVYFDIHPAERDVGIMSDYAEIQGVSAYVAPWGEIMINTHECYEDQLDEAANEWVDGLSDYGEEY